MLKPLLIPLHLGPRNVNESPDITAQRQNLTFEMAQMNPDGFRKWPSLPNERQLARRQFKRERKQFTLDAIRQERLDFIEKYKYTTIPKRVARLTALLHIESRRAVA